MKKAILITGINGFLASHIAKDLKDEYKIIGLANSVDNLYRIKNHNEYKIYSSKTDSLESIFKEQSIFAVIHLATVYRRNEEPLLPLLKTNLILPINLLELSRKYNVQTFINTDSFFNSNEHDYSYLSYYTLSKKNTLEWIKAFKNDFKGKIINMKIFHMYGENDSKNKFIPSVIDKLKSNIPFLDLTPGNQTRDFIYVKDVVRAFRTVIENIDGILKFQEFEIGTGKSHSIKELVLLAKEILNSNTELRFGAIPYRDGEIMESNIKNKDLHDVFNWKPLFSLESGIKTLVL